MNTTARQLKLGSERVRMQQDDHYKHSRTSTAENNGVAVEQSKSRPQPD